jgi:hypothetical protein
METPLWKNIGVINVDFHYCDKIYPLLIKHKYMQETTVGQEYCVLSLLNANNKGHKMNTNF